MIFISAQKVGDWLGQEENLILKLAGHVCHSV